MEADSVVEEARAKAVSAVNDLPGGRRPEEIRIEADSIAEEVRGSLCASATSRRPRCSWRPSHGSSNSRRRQLATRADVEAKERAAREAKRGRRRKPSGRQRPARRRRPRWRRTS